MDSVGLLHAVAVGGPSEAAADVDAAAVRVR